MNNLLIATWAEYKKIYKTAIFWVTIVIFIFIALMIGLLMFAIKNPDLSQKIGLIGSKAAMLKFNTINWITYFDLLNQLIAGIGLLGFGFISSWVFGREYYDKTFKDLLALPISRSYIVYAKFIVILLWSFCLSLLTFLIGLVDGFLIQLSGFTYTVLSQNFEKFLFISLMTVLISSVVAFIANITKGYLAPIGFLLLMLAVTQFAGLLSFDHYFPWAVPILYAQGEKTIKFSSYGILIVTSIAGFWATIFWWKHSDHS